MGDSYVRDEFRRHTMVEPNRILSFMKEWEWYEKNLQTQLVTSQSSTTSTTSATLSDTPSSSSESVTSSEKPFLFSPSTRINSPSHEENPTQRFNSSASISVVPLESHSLTTLGSKLNVGLLTDQQIGQLWVLKEEVQKLGKK